MGVQQGMIERYNRLVIALILFFHLRLRNKLGRLHNHAKVVHLGGFGYHGNLLVVFGFWCVVCHFFHAGTLGQDWNVSGMPTLERQEMRRHRK